MPHTPKFRNVPIERSPNENSWQAAAFQQILDLVSRQEAEQAKWFSCAQRQFGEFREQLGQVHDCVQNHFKDVDCSAFAMAPADKDATAFETTENGRALVPESLRHALHELVPPTRAPEKVCDVLRPPVTPRPSLEQASTTAPIVPDKQALCLRFGDTGSDALDNSKLEKVEHDDTAVSQSTTRGRKTSVHSHILQKRMNSHVFQGGLVANRCTLVADSTVFKTASALLVLGNCLFVGVEADVHIRHVFKTGAEMKSGGMDLINHAFAVFFAIELVLRIWGYRIHFFLGEEWKWNVFDGTLVICTLAEYVFSGLSGVSALRVIRTLRLARTLRIVRVVTVFRHLQLIVQGLWCSFLSLLWMLLLLTLCLYLVSIVFVAAVSSYLVSTPVGTDSTLPGDGLPSNQLRESFERHFRTLPRAMLSMFFSVTGGTDWYDVVQPLMNISIAYVVVFALFIIFVVFGIFNVLNGVFVEAVLTNRDKELVIQQETERTHVFLRDMADLFKEADSNGDNILTKEELDLYCHNPRFCAYLSTHALDASDAKTLFDYLDADGSGEIDMDEFALGTLKVKGPARCLDLIKVHTCFTSLHEQLEEVKSALAELPEARRLQISSCQ